LNKILRNKTTQNLTKRIDVMNHKNTISMILAITFLLTGCNQQENISNTAEDPILSKLESVNAESPQDNVPDEMPDFPDDMSNAVDLDSLDANSIRQHYNTAMQECDEKSKANMQKLRNEWNELKKDEYEAHKGEKYYVPKRTMAYFQRGTANFHTQCMSEYGFDVSPNFHNQLILEKSSIYAQCSQKDSQELKEQCLEENGWGKESKKNVLLNLLG